MVNNKEKEKKSGFNIIDLIIILFIILAVTGIIMKYNLADTINLNAKGDTFEIEFETAWDVQEASQQYFRSGVSLYVTTESTKIGDIIEVLDVRNPASYYSVDVHGKIIHTELPDRVDVKCVMTSRGRITKNGEYMINGNTFVAPNQEFLIHTGEWEGTIRILSVKKVSE